MNWDEDAMRSATKINPDEAEMAVFLCDPNWLAGEVDVVAAGQVGDGTERNPTATYGRDWILCSSACGLAMIRLGPKPGGSGTGDDSSKDDGRATEPSSEADNDDDANLTIGDMIRIQREIGRLSDRAPAKNKPPSKALAS